MGEDPCRRYVRSLERRVSDDQGFADLELDSAKVLEVLKDIEDRGAVETAKRATAHFIGVHPRHRKGIAEKDPAEKLGAVLKPLRKGRQPAITDLARLRKMISDAGGLCSTDHPVGRLLSLAAVRRAEPMGGVRKSQRQRAALAYPAWMKVIWTARTKSAGIILFRWFRRALQCCVRSGADRRRKSVVVNTGIKTGQAPV
jgi:hypothetical protein